MLKLIVNADDFGLCEAVNEGIVQAHQNGIVTSASIMANGSAFDHAMRLCRLVPSLDLGIHLTLVEEQPLRDPGTIPTLVSVRGTLHPHATTFMKKYISGAIRVHEVWSELEAQIEKVVNQGITVSHLDSHQHLHMLPKIRRICIELAKKYNIPAIRVPSERLRSYMLKMAKSASRVPQLLTLNGFSRFGKNMPLRRPDHFVGFFFGGNLHKENLQTLLQHLPLEGTCELMCHPGKTGAQATYGHWAYRWSDELNALTDPRIADVLRQKSIQLISYRELARY
jgi:hopanoid biosynthesis associated protein HpnK